MPRFVLLYHDCPPGYVRPSHWDLMLEAGDVLETWALAQLPRAWQAAHLRTVATHPHCPPLSDGNTIPAEKLPDHRLAYLDYEGPVSGGRGEVAQISAGNFQQLSRSERYWTIEVVAGLTSTRFTLQKVAQPQVAEMIAHQSGWSLSIVVCRSN